MTAAEEAVEKLLKRYGIEKAHSEENPFTALGFAMGDDLSYEAALLAVFVAGTEAVSETAIRAAVLANYGDEPEEPELVNLEELLDNALAANMIDGAAIISLLKAVTNGD